MERSRWLPTIRPGSQAPLRLLCLPHAGGAASCFRGWIRAVSPLVEVLPLQLPGRETRWGETPIPHVRPLVELAARDLRPWLDKPFALLGQSMGALLAFELVRELRRRRAPQPLHLFVAGGAAPQTRRRGRPTYLLGDVAFVEELRRLQGTPPEVLAHPELLDLMLPIVRGDFELYDTYTYTHEPPLACSISAYGGADDRGVPPQMIDAWKFQTTGRFHTRIFPGGHFFFRSAERLLIREVSRELAELTGSLAPCRS